MSVDAWNWKYYTWTNVFNKNEVKQICEFIENNYVKLEGPELGAHDKDGNYKKQISSVKVIHYETIEPLISRLIKLAFQVANLDFGYITFGGSLTKSRALIVPSHTGP